MADDDLAADLAVATAAAAGDEAAIEQVHRRLVAQRAKIPHGIVPADELDEVIQGVSIRLLVDRHIDRYAGLGPLDAWLRVVALRAALSARRKLGARDEVAWLEMQLSSELSPAWRRTVPGIRAAFELAVRELAPRERLVLRQHFVDGVAAEALARIHGVTRMSVYRWIAHAKAAVLARIREEVGTQLALSPTEVDSLMREVRSSFSITVERVLATGAD
jgi:RNA polymerase sigma-70 factor, ECF subfamily